LNDLKISDAVFTVIDLETTGGVKPEHSIIEFSALKVRRGEIMDEFTSLVNPRQPISFFISQYTGITNEMVRHAPVIADLLPQLKQFIGTSVFVAHNLSFDLGFVNMELERHGYEPLENPALCTVRLARRLLPKTQRKNLGELAASFGIEIQNRHRAKGDALATVRVLTELINLAAVEHGAEHLQELLSLQYQPMRKFKREPRHIQKIRNHLLPKLPEKTGVYFFYSAKDELLYIGKSKNLKARVSSYFTHNAEKPDKVKELVSVVRRVEWQPTGSELEALLIESRLIKLHRPRYNTMLKRYKSYPFLRLTAHQFPRLETATEVQPDGAEYFGPFSSMEVVQDVLDVMNKNFLLRECSDVEFKKGRACVYADLHRCLAPCEPHRFTSTRYNEELARVRRFLSGQNAEIIDVLMEKMKRLADELRFEEAAELRGKIQSLRRVFYRQSDITASVNQNNLLILLPSENHSKSVKEFTILFVRFGRLVAQTKIFPETAEQLGSWVQGIYSAGETAPEQCRKEEIDEMQILSSWIYHNRETLSCLYIGAEQTLQEILAELSERLLKLTQSAAVSEETELAE
jgi:DNA polymerase-3 subunit epsilon